jgi:hypothetical protein
MPTHKTYTWNELSAFIRSQKDDRMLNSQDHSTDDIGDLLTHFGRKKLKKTINDVGMTCIGYGNIKKKYMVPASSDDTGKIVNLVGNLINRNVETYKEVKEQLDMIEK